MRSIPQRNAARVLPEPVGAQISVFAPVAMTGQPAVCAGVGPAKDAPDAPVVDAADGEVK